MGLLWGGSTRLRVLALVTPIYTVRRTAPTRCALRTSTSSTVRPLYVYAVAADDANDSDTVLEAGFLGLGPLKGNQGNQTYELPVDFDPAKYRAISVWCERFSVNFATVPLP